MNAQAPTAEFFVSNENEWKTEWNAAKKPLPHAEVREYERAVIVPLRWRKNGPKRNFEGGIVSETGEYLAGHLRALDDSDPPFTARTSYGIPSDAIRERDEEVIFGGVLFDHIGHLITDSSARLWYPVSTRDTRKIVFLRSPEFKNWSSVDWRPLLELAGLDPARIEVLDEPTRFRKVIVPQEAYYAHGGFRPEWTSFFDAVRSHVAPGDRRRVYLSRSKFARGNVFNEDLFEQYYREQGFYVAYPEELDFRQKVELISGADELVATIGTTSHLFLFARPGVRATVLLRTSSVLKMQFYIGAACAENCSYVESFRNILPSYHAAGVYYLAPTPRFQNYLRTHAMPSFGTTRCASVHAAERVAPYVEKWLEVFGANPDTFKASKSAMFRAMGGLAGLSSRLGPSGDGAQLSAGISAFVGSALERAAELATTRAELEKTRAKLKKAELEMNRMWRRSFRGRVYSLLCLLRLVRPDAKPAKSSCPREPM